jgi:carboxymethylenebutenolidase
MTPPKGTEVPKITQEMVRLYDDYTHLTLDRRGFMDKLARLAGSGVLAAAIAPMLGADQARAALVPPEDLRLTTERVTFPGAGAATLSGYLVRRSDITGKFPAVLVIHENRGLNPHIEDVARRLALDGFLTLAVDFLSPSGGTPGDEDAAREMISKIDQAAVVANAAAAVDWLHANEHSTGKVGAVGFCWGGGVVNRLAVADPDLSAGVAYYGRQPTEGVDRIKAKLLLHYAGLDEGVNAGVAAYEAALKAAGIDYQLYMYDGVNHAFNNDTSAARYDKAAAELAWSRTVAFLRESLT